MATVNFSIRSKNNPARIYVRLKAGRTVDVKAPTDLYINPTDWNHAKGKPRLKDTSLKNIDTDLNNLQAEIVARLNQCSPDDDINTQWVKDIINPPPPEEPLELPEDIITYFDKFIEAKKDDVKKGTINKYITIRNLLERMQAETGTIHIKDVGNGFKSKFESYCVSNGYATATIGRAVKAIKTVCRDARSNGMESHPQLDLLKGKKYETDHIHLTFDELDTIQQTDLPEYLDNARDWLIISCYTGQRVSDFMRFTKDMIRTEKGKKLIEFTQVKTGKIMTVPLHKKAIEVLKKRDGEFPRQISDQRYNDYIKEVCKRAGLTYTVKGSKKNPDTNRKETRTFEKWELVASHIGRRSFSSNFYGIIPTSLLIHATGHSTESQFLAYIGKTDTQKAMQLADYF